MEADTTVLNVLDDSSSFCLLERYADRLVWADDVSVSQGHILPPQGFYLCFIEAENEYNLGVRIVPYDTSGRLDQSSVATWLRNREREEESRRRLEGCSTLVSQTQGDAVFESGGASNKGHLYPPVANLCSASSAIPDLIIIPKDLTVSFSVPDDWKRPNASNLTPRGVIHGGVADCAELPCLDFPSVLLNLRRRYLRKTTGSQHADPQVYTYAGNVLLAINPYRRLTQYFEPNESPVPFFSSARTRKLPPHPFSIAEICFRRLMQWNTSQTVIVSGDSGAGKTETSKMMMHYLALRQRKDGSPSVSNATASLTSSTPHRALPHPTSSLLEMNPVLESFGNATTLRNKNSSRFGRLNKLFLSEGHLVGVGVNAYLLERSRVTHQNPGERNFHVFYQLVQDSDPTFLTELGLTQNVSDYTILSPQNTKVVLPELVSAPSETTPVASDTPLPRRPLFRKATDQLPSPPRSGSQRESSLDGLANSYETPAPGGVPPAEHVTFTSLTDKLLDNGFSSSEVTEMARILAAILHLGNITEANVRSSDLHSVEVIFSYDTPPPVAPTLSKGLHDAQLKFQSESTPAMIGEQGRALYNIVLATLTQLDVYCCAFARKQSLAKAAELLGVAPKSLATVIRSRRLGTKRETVVTPRPESSRLSVIRSVMRWMYSRLFENVIVERLNISATSKTPQPETYIAILDIFGFEDLETNSFEQLLINVANEKLQNFFTEHLIVAEQLKYSDQNIHWKPIHVDACDDVLHCLVGGRIPASSTILTRSKTPPPRGDPCSAPRPHNPNAPSAVDAFDALGTPLTKSKSLFFTDSRRQKTTQREVSKSPLPSTVDPPAVLSCLNDIGRVASSDLTDDAKPHNATFYRKIQALQTHYSNVFRWNPKTATHHVPPMSFVVRHFAGEVLYTVDDWIAKDNDKILPEVTDCLLASSSTLVTRLLPADSAEGSAIARFRPLAKRFIQELDTLLCNLAATSLSFIRCFLPNRHQRSSEFDGSLVAKQMRQSGTLELLRLCQLGYSFHQEYRVIERHFDWLLGHFISVTTPSSQRKPFLKAFRSPNPGGYTSSLYKDAYPLLGNPRLLAEMALRLFAPHSQSDWEFGRTLLFARSPLDETLRQLLAYDIVPSRAGSQTTLLKTLGWCIPQPSDITAFYRRLASRPWRQIVKPLVVVLKLFRHVRRESLTLTLTKPLLRRAIGRWVSFRKHVDISVHQPGSRPDPEPSNLFFEQHYSTPWFYVWRHQIFRIPSCNSVFFFDGAYLWISDQQKARDISNSHSVKPSHAHRLIFQRYVHPRTQAQRLSGPKRRPAQPQPLPPTDVPDTPLSIGCGPSGNRGFHASLEPTEDALLGMIQHPVIENLFAVLSHSWCLLTFHVKPLSTSARSGELSDKENVRDTKLHTTGQLTGLSRKLENRYKRSESQLSSQVALMTQSRRSVDVLHLILQAFEKSSRARLYNFQRLQFLKFVFPYGHVDSVVMILWALPSMADVDPHHPPSNLLVALIDLNAGKLISLLLTRLPYYKHVFEAARVASCRRWSSFFPRYADMSTRPSYSALLEASILQPILPSSRGVVWAGPGFCKIFRLSSVFTQNANPTSNMPPDIYKEQSALPHTAVNIQLVWDAQSTTDAVFSGAKQDLLLESQAMPWLFWITAAASPIHAHGQPDASGGSAAAQPSWTHSREGGNVKKNSLSATSSFRTTDAEKRRRRISLERLGLLESDTGRKTTSLSLFSEETCILETICHRYVVLHFSSAHDPLNVWRAEVLEGGTNADRSSSLGLYRLPNPSTDTALHKPPILLVRTSRAGTVDVLQLDNGKIHCLCSAPATGLSSSKPIKPLLANTSISKSLKLTAGTFYVNDQTVYFAAADLRAGTLQTWALGPEAAARRSLFNAPKRFFDMHTIELLPRASEAVRYARQLISPELPR